MAGPLTLPGRAHPRVDRRDRRALLATLAGVLLLHALALAALSQLLQPPSLLTPMVEPMYTRTITVQAPAPEPVAPVAAPTRPSRPSATIRRPRAATRPTPPAAPASEAVAQAPPEPAAEAIPGPAPPSAAPEAAPRTTIAPTETGDTTTSADATGDGAAGTAAPAYLAQWPGNTRLTYRVGGNYRGELHGSAEVSWQRDGARYQTAVQLDMGLLVSLRLTSQGVITEQGLRPAVYEEQTRNRRRGVRLGEDVRLNNGERVPRPEDVQDAASQFVELGHRFATGQTALVPGASVRLWLARPGGVDEWTYDVIGEETLYLPRLGAVAAMHMKPRPLEKPRGPIRAEIWFAPTLQYLPVRILLIQGADTYLDLMVDTIEQQ